MKTSMRWISVAVLLSVALFVSAVVASDDLEEAWPRVEEGRSEDPEAMFLRGLLLAEGSREQEARRIFEDIVDLHPDRPEPLNNLAVIQAAMGEYETAVETLREALRTHPAYRTAYENLTKIYGQLASEAYSRALSVDQAHERSSVELVLLTEMVLPQPAPAAMAKAETVMPVAPLPAAPEPEATEAMLEEPMVDEPPVVIAETGTTPDEAITEALNEEEMSESAPAEPGEQPAVEASDEPIEAEAPLPALEAEPASADTADTGPAPDTTAAERVELASLVEAWALAWSEQRVDDYLYFYGEKFKPQGEMPRADWERLRRQRIAGPEAIKVSVAFLDFEILDAAHAAVRFNQSYESDTFSDVVTKTLALAREIEGWKIVRETLDS